MRQTNNALIIAFGCEPGRGSEPGIGWATLAASAMFRPTWVICHPVHREVLDAAIAEWNRGGEGHEMHAIYVDVGGLASRFEGAGYFGFNVYYYLWCRAAGRAAVELHERVGIDVVQHVSLTRWWMPSAGLALAERGVPLVWGPLGGGETMPLRYRREIGARGHLTEFARAAARALFALDPALRRCARATAIGVSEPVETERRLRRLGVRRITRGMSLPAYTERMRQIEPMLKPPGSFRVVSGGGLVYWKSFHLSLRAFAEAFRDVADAEYVHVCGGQEMERMRREAERLGIADRVTLTGDLPHRDSLRWVASADAYVLPTMRDTIGHLFDALAAGVPCVASDHLSPHTVLDARCGRLISLRGGPNAFVSAMATVLRDLQADERLHSQLSAGARQRASELDEESFCTHVRTLQDEAVAEVQRRTGSCPLHQSPQVDVVGLKAVQLR